MNRMSSTFSLCLALSSVTAQAVCQAVYFMRVKYLCIALVMCFGDAPVVNASLPPSFFPSRPLSLCFVSPVHIVFRCSPLFLNIASPFLSLVLSSLTLSLHLSLSRHRIATPLCASSLIPKAMHFSEPFENRLIHFILTLHMHTYTPANTHCLSTVHH